MNSDILLDAIGEADERYIFSAWARLEGEMPGRKKPYIKRVFTVLAAAVVLIMALFTTGMALNEDFRGFVFEVLNISQLEEVPDFGAANTLSPVTTEQPLVMEPERVDIGGAIEGRYIHAPVGGAAREGVFLVCTDEVSMNSGNHYDAYVELDGEFVKLEEYDFCHDYTILGNDFHVEFQWAKHDSGVVFTYIAPEVDFRTYNHGGTSEAVLVYFNCHGLGAEGNGWTHYPVLLNFDTGEVTDILAGTEAEKLLHMYQFALSGDKSGMLICCWAYPERDEESLYYVDLVNGRLYDLEEISGEKPDECCLTGSGLVCWTKESIKVGNGTLSAYSAWAIDLDTMQRRDIFSGIPATDYANFGDWQNITFESLLEHPEIWEYSGGELLGQECSLGIVFIEGFDHMNHSGNMYAGSSFALAVDAQRNVYVLDLFTGSVSLMEGFELSDDMEMIPSQDGEKLLIYCTDDPQYTGRIGVLDTEDMRYVQFDRINENSSDEFAVYWYDNEQIIVCGETKTADGARHEDYYIYTLK